jgi:hypothetical protein
MECFIGERSPWPEYRILFLWRMRLKDTKFVKQVEVDQYSVIVTDATQMLSSTIKWQFLEEFSKPLINVSIVFFFFFFFIQLRVRLFLWVGDFFFFFNEIWV